MGGNLECINLCKTKFQLNCRYSSSLAGSLKSYPIQPVQHAYLSPLPDMYTIPSISNLFVVLEMSSPSYIMLHLCFPLPILFFSFTPQLLTTSSLPVKIPPLLWRHPWLPQTGWMHPPIIGYMVLFIVAVTFMPTPGDYKLTESRAIRLFIFVFPGPRIAWHKVA